ncbi:MAG: type II toxin-antitoxin system prevent-host-death family antitoxin [Candidatus Rokubacteria bacterium]|nr:type II toxin-antitoxin system prevent-host-death family antitoxin [Candidatus Rokubacteria bacterium]
MHGVGVRELKNRLTRYLALVKEGERVVVTDRGKPVAVLGPIEEQDGRRLSKAQRAAALARRGVITLPQGTRDLRTPPVTIRGEPISRTLIRDRR